jgi:hypothetical protein
MTARPFVQLYGGSPLCAAPYRSRTEESFGYASRLNRLHRCSLGRGWRYDREAIWPELSLLAAGRRPQATESRLGGSGGRERNTQTWLKSRTTTR